MKIKLIRKTSENRELIKQTICYNKLNSFFGQEKKFKVMEAGVEMSEIFLKIKNTKNQEVCRLGLSPFINNQDFLNYENKLFLYARNSDYEINRKINRLILKILYVNFSANKLLLPQVLDLISRESVLETEDKVEKLRKNKTKFLNFFQQLSLVPIQKFWPFVENYKCIGFNLAAEDRGGRFYYILRDKLAKHYFLKIYLDNGGENKQIVRTVNELNIFLAKKINLPKIIDCQTDLEIGGLKASLVLYEFINADSRISWSNIAQVAALIARLHQVRIDSLRNKVTAAFFQNTLLESIKKQEVNVESIEFLTEYSRNLLRKSFLFFKSLSPIMGLCHFDLEERNIFMNNNQAYLIDFDYSRFDDIFFDLASLLNDFIKNDKQEIAPDFLRFYFDLNKGVSYDRKHLFFASVVMAVLNNTEKAEINKTLQKIELFYSNLWF